MVFARLDLRVKTLVAHCFTRFVLVVVRNIPTVFGHGSVAASVEGRNGEQLWVSMQVVQLVFNAGICETPVLVMLGTYMLLRGSELPSSIEWLRPIS